MSKRVPIGKPIYSPLPADVEGFDSLAELALDMRSSWNHATHQVWRQLDPVLWELTRNPWVVLQTVSRDRIEGVLVDPVFRANVDDLVRNRRQGLFNCYESFIHIVDSMFNQHAKWLKVTADLPWRRRIASLNYLLASHVWQQMHNGFTHQDPSFIDHVVNKKASVVRVYLPPDANCLLSVWDHCLRSRHYVNVVIAGKYQAPQWLSMDDAVKHCRAGVGIWNWAGTDGGLEPDVVMACCGEVPTLETLAAVAIMREHLPDLRIRVVNVVDLMKLQPQSEHPHGLSDQAFDALFTTDKPIIFTFHGYPWLIHRLTYRRTNHYNLHVRGYKEEDTITTPRRHDGAERSGPLSSRYGHHRPPAADRRSGHPPETAASREADRAQGLHQ